MHSYTIHLDGANRGPFPAEELLAKIRAGEVPLATLAWRPGLAEWGPLDRVLAADGLLPPELAAPVPPPLVRPAIATPVAAPAKPDNWLIPSILSTVCCCIPLGIPAIIFAVKVDSEYKAGNHAAALAASKKAQLFFWLAFGLGLLANLLAVAIQLMVASGA